MEPINTITPTEASPNLVSANKNKKDNNLINANSSNDSSVHTFSEEEKVAYSKFINEKLTENDDSLSNYIPIDPSTDQLFVNCSDGVLLNKLMESLFSNQQVSLKGLSIKNNMNPFEMIQNQNIVIKNAVNVKCKVVNIGGEDLVKGTPYLVLGVIWQIIKQGLLSKVNQNANEDILEMLFEEEKPTTTTDNSNNKESEGDDNNENTKIDDNETSNKKSEEHSAEEILIRWVNYHLEKDGSSRRISNFSDDIKDSVIYSHLFHQLLPIEFQNLVSTVSSESNLVSRAQFITNGCEKLGVKCFLTPNDIALGHPKLNLALVASLFNSSAAIESLRREREEKHRLEQEKLERERLERERIELEQKKRLEIERLEKERLEREKAEIDEKTRLENEKLEAERIERERLEKTRLEAELLERQRFEQKEEEKEYRIAIRIQKQLTAESLVIDKSKKLVLDIADTKRNIIGELKNTSNRRKELHKITKSIDRVLENKKESKLLKKEKKSNTVVIKPVKGAPSALDKEKMKSYQNLFYYLQTNPEVMGKLLFILDVNQMGKTFDNLFLSMFPYEISPREEDFFLKSIAIGIEYQIKFSENVNDLLQSNSVPMILLYRYFKKKGFKYLKEEITPLIVEVLDQSSELNLNFDPFWIEKEIQISKEIKEGKKGEDSNKEKKTFEKLMENDEISSLFSSRSIKLVEIVNKFFKGIIGSIDKLPVQLRYLCNIISEKSKSIFKDSKPSTDRFISYFLIIYRFINPILSSPDLLDELVLLQHPYINKQARFNLSQVSRLIQSVFSGNSWTDSNFPTVTINTWIDENKALADKYLNQIPNVPDLDELIHYTEYSETMIENNIKYSTIIGISEIIWLHETILSNYYDLEDIGTICDRSKDKIRSLVKNTITTRTEKGKYKPTSESVDKKSKQWQLKELLDDIEQPIQLPEQGDRNIQLSFINKEDSKAVDNWKECKLLMIDILSKCQTPKQNQNTIDILNDCVKYFKDNKEKSDPESIMLAKSEKLINTLKTFERERCTDANAENGADDKYNLFLLDVEKELVIINRKNNVMNSEIVRVQELLRSVRTDVIPLEHLIKFQNEQLSKVMAKKQLKSSQVTIKDKSIKPHKFILSDLIKKGMVLSCDVPESAYSKTKIYIKSSSPGVFEIEAKFGLISKSIELELDDLLIKSKNHITEYPLDGITLDVTLTIHTLTKLFSL